MVPMHVRIRTPKRQPEKVPGSRSAGNSVALAVAGVFAVMGAAHAQTVVIQPQVDARLTYSDNVGAEKDGSGDWTAELSPAVSVRRDGGRVTGNLNARVRNVMYASESSRNDTFLMLQGRGQVEAVERTLFIDMDATMNRNNRSAFGGRLAGDTLDTDSDNETRSFGIGPRLHFRLGPETAGTVSYMSRWSSGGGSIADRHQGDWHGQLSNPVQFGRLGWGLDYSRSDTSFGGRGGEDVSDEAARATLFAKITPQFRLRGIVGYEKNDYAKRKGESSTITGAGFDWNPTERTTLVGTTERRVFGNGYDLRLNHRHALSSWNLSVSRDISSSAQASGFDVFSDPEFRALYDALEAAIPDPLQREAQVRRQLGFPAIGQRDSFFTNAHFVTRNISGSVSLLGVRNVLTMVLQRSERSRLGAAVTNDPADDFARFDTVTTRSVTLALSHRLSPWTSLNASVLRSDSEGAGGAKADSRRFMCTVGASTQFSPDTTGALIYTYQKTDGINDFVENILTASLSMRF